METNSELRFWAAAAPVVVSVLELPGEDKASKLTFTFEIWENSIERNIPFVDFVIKSQSEEFLPSWNWASWLLSRGRWRSSWNICKLVFACGIFVVRISLLFEKGRFVEVKRPVQAGLPLAGEVVDASGSGRAAARVAWREVFLATTAPPQLLIMFGLSHHDVRGFCHFTFWSHPKVEKKGIHPLRAWSNLRSR